MKAAKIHVNVRSPPNHKNEQPQLFCIDRKHNPIFSAQTKPADCCDGRRYHPAYQCLGEGYAALFQPEPRMQALIYDPSSAGRQLAAALANSDVHIIGLVD